MTTTTYGSGHAAATPTTGRRERGVFLRILDRMTEARQRQADRVVSSYLLTLDDRTLEQLGYDRKMLETRSAGFGTSL